MPNLVSMKRTAAEKDNSGSSILSSVDEDQFPFGLTVNLEDESIRKLGLGPVSVGDKMTLVAAVKVTRMSEREDEEDGLSRDVTLQITDMQLESGEPEDVITTLYGSSHKENR